MFVMDPDGTDSTFNLQKRSLSKLIEAKIISNDATRVGITLTSKILIGLGSIVEKEQLLNRVRSFSVGENVEFIKGLQLAKKELLLFSRPQASSTVIIFMTQGRSSNVAGLIKKMKKSGTTVIVIGIGDRISKDDIKDVNGDDEEVFVIKTEDEMNEVLKKVTEVSSPGKN